MGDGMQRTPGGRLIRYEIAKLLLEYVYWSAFCFDKLLSKSPSFKASLSSSRPLSSCSRTSANIHPFLSPYFQTSTHAPKTPIFVGLTMNSPKQKVRIGKCSLPDVSRFIFDNVAAQHENLAGDSILLCRACVTQLAIRNTMGTLTIEFTSAIFIYRGQSSLQKHLPPYPRAFIFHTTEEKVADFRILGRGGILHWRTNIPSRVFWLQKGWLKTQTTSSLVVFT